jgi:hypothetical protein
VACEASKLPFICYKQTYRKTPFILHLSPEEVDIQWNALKGEDSRPFNEIIVTFAHEWHVPM